MALSFDFDPFQALDFDLGGLASSAAGDFAGDLVADWNQDPGIAASPVSYAQPTMGAAPNLLPVPSGTGSLALQFPALYTAIMTWRGKGIRIGINSLWALLKKFGPGFLVSAGILSAQAITELVLARSTRKRRRMNVLNPRALSRSTRRLVGFERRAAKVSAALSHLGKRRTRRAGRCFKCHRNPCAC